MKNNKKIITKLKKFFVFSSLFALALPALSMPVFASNANVAGAVTGAVNTYMKPQIKQICNNVVFPLIALGLGVGLVFSIAHAVRGYRREGDFDWHLPAILLCALIFVLTASKWVWSAIGW